MAFSKKTWKDRVSEQPQRRLLTPVGSGSAQTVDVTRQEGIVIQEGDAFSANNMNDLENRIKNCFDADEATINSVNTKANTNAQNITSLQNNIASVSNRVTANTNNISALNTRMTNAENTINSHTGSISSLSTRMGTAEGKLTTIEDELTANNNRIYMDYKNGRYGYNTSANRGADTFHPFNSCTLIGAYSGDTSVDVTRFHAGSVNEFLLVPDKLAMTQASTHMTATPSLTTWNVLISYTPPTLTLSNNTLSVVAPSVIGKSTLDNDSAGFHDMTQGKVLIPYKLYYVGIIIS